MNDWSWIKGGKIAYSSSNACLEKSRGKYAVGAAAMPVAAVLLVPKSGSR